MSAYEYQQPIIHLKCDRVGCPSFFEAPAEYDKRFENNTRRAAKAVGWDVPPPYGKGSRRGTDFCSQHAGEVTE